MQRIKAVKTTLSTTATNNTVGTGTVDLNGIIRGIKIKAPATVTSSATTGVAITDPDGDQVYSKTGVAAAATNQDYFDTQTAPSPLNIPVAGTYTLTATMSANQAAARSVDVTILLESYL